MKILCTTVLLTVTSLTAFGQFTAGNLAVVRSGDGAETLANTGNSIFIDQYTVLGSFVNSVAVPNSGSGGMVINGTATADGALSRSADGQYLTVSMYNRAVGGSGTVSGTTSATVPRAIGVINAAGTYSAGPATTSQFSASNFRSSVTDGNNNYWGLGGNSGTYYFGTASSATTIQSAGASNGRTMNIFNGNLYFSTGITGGSGPGIYGFAGGGQPVTATTTNAFILTGTGSSPYDFAINSAGDLAYIADDRSIASGGGIQKWVFSAGAWSLSYTLGTGTGSTVGARGLAVDFTTGTIFATTAESTSDRIISILDTGAGSTATTLATAGANQIFRGLDFTPQSIPEPTTLSLFGGFGLLYLIVRRRK